MELRPACQVILFGDEAGTAAFARSAGVEHVAEVTRTPYGTPLLHTVFAEAARLSAFSLLCCVNSDIILPPTFAECMNKVKVPDFLVIGQRLDVDLEDVFDGDYEGLAARGTVHVPYGSDYFVFPRTLFADIPPFAIGRPSWDNWMIFRARQLGIPVIDATPSMYVLHQNHGYGHVPEARGHQYDGPEGDMNRMLAGEAGRQFTLRYATWKLTPSGLSKIRWWQQDRGAALHAMMVFHPWTRPLGWVVNSAIKVRNRRAQVKSTT